MATTEATLRAVHRERSADTGRDLGAWLSTALTPLAILIHGYHPYAEDGGVYLAGIKRLLDPALYPHSPGFVTAHLHFSQFAHGVAEFSRILHVGLMPIVFALYAAGIWLTLFAAWQIAERCGLTRRACCGAVSLLALALTVPVAGTSLMLMDPYLTARSISTPFGLLALACALDITRDLKHISLKSIALCAVSLAIAAAVHPLMAAYSLGGVLLLVCISLTSPRARIAATASVCLSAIVLAAVLEWLGPHQTSAYAEVARTRTYWFIESWHWYEVFGLAAPPAILVLAASLARTTAARRLAWSAVIAAGMATLIAAAFAEYSSPNYIVARLQPLRIYQTIYILMLLALGATAAERFSKAGWLGRTAIFALVGGTMTFVQICTFPHSAHIELPGRVPLNAWQQGFEWIRTNTPRDAVFALDANYIDEPGEDSQNFRAIAERSAIPDYAKDGGIASIAPDLATEWMEGEAAGKDIDRGIGPSQITRLRELAVDWVVVLRNTPTTLTCAYANDSIKICCLSQ